MLSEKSPEFARNWIPLMVTIFYKCENETEEGILVTIPENTFL
jgi:hypothetical protein